MQIKVSTNQHTRKPASPSVDSLESDLFLPLSPSRPAHLCCANDMFKESLEYTRLLQVVDQLGILRLAFLKQFIFI